MKQVATFWRAPDGEKRMGAYRPGAARHAPCMRALITR
jgi:hypothetical protein